VVHGLRCPSRGRHPHPAHAVAGNCRYRWLQ
jgi:hypothetical protein